MSNLEKRIVLDEGIERVFQYADESDQSPAAQWGPLEVREVHRLLDGMFYTQQVYTWKGWPHDQWELQTEFEADQAALTTQLHDFDLVMTWNSSRGQRSAPRLSLDGDHTYWSSS